MRTSSFRIVAVALLIGLASTVVVASDSPTSQADALFAAGKFEEAADAYQAVAAAQPDLGAAWFGLGRSAIRLPDYDRANAAFTRSLELQHQAGWSMFGAARAEAGLGNADRAIEWLLKMSETGVVASLVAGQTPEIGKLSDHPRYEEALHGLRPCRSPEHRQFDFWIGDWDVRNQQAPQRPASHNRISSREGGCVVLEEYDTPSGYTGVSINFYDPGKQQWHQTWMDNQGAPILHSGGIVDGSMVLMDDPDGQTINRTTWTPIDRDHVRQHWEISRDGGETWSTLFDGMYTRRKPGAASPSGRQGS